MIKLAIAFALGYFARQAELKRGIDDLLKKHEQKQADSAA